MATNEESAIEQELKCGICLETYENPKYVGACHHTFCSQCMEQVIQTHANRGMFSCPTCRRMYPIPYGGVGELQNDFRAVSMIRAMRSSQKQQPCSSREVADVPTCRVCRAARASSYCEQCGGGIHLCVPCAGKHAQTAATSNHVVVSIGEVCGPHEEPLKLYCLTCSKRLCHICLLTEHTEHDVKDRTILLETTKQTLEKSYAESVWMKKILESAGTEVATMGTSISEAVRRETQMREQKTRDLSAKMADVENQIIRLEKRRQELREELRTELRSRSEWEWAANQLGTLQDDIRTVSADLDNMLERVMSLKNADLTTVREEKNLLAVAKDFEKHLDMARRTTQAAADIKANLCSVVNDTGLPSRTPDFAQVTPSTWPRVV